MEEELSSLLSSWNTHFPPLVRAPERDKADGIADFYYDLLRIHPFLEYKGALAHFFLRKFLRELLGKVLPGDLDERKLMTDVLGHVSKGNRQSARDLIWDVIRACPHTH